VLTELLTATSVLIYCGESIAIDVSQPATLQLFEAKWTTIENRVADIHKAGYGQLWLPSPSRASSGNQSVGYDLFDRFDLGGPRNETLYGTQRSLMSQIEAAHKAGLKVDVEMIWNHNGFGNSNDASFVAKGGYPGFALTLPGDPYGDFHNPSATSVLELQVSGLVDIAQEKNYQFIRHPVAAGNPQNIPAGTTYNKPNQTNAILYPDRDLPGLTLTDPALGTTVTRYAFNSANPLAGDPVAENATGLLMRSAQWMVEEIGVDGFRIDAAKHIPTNIFNYYDQAVFRANPRLNLDGSYQPVYAYSEALDGNKALLQSYIRQDLPNRVSIAADDTTVRGNRDVLDFPLFYALRDNLTGNGTVNNWHKIRNASMDLNDDGLRNGSQGVSFVDSHDNLGGGFPYLKNVAYAYTLMRPGHAIVYLNVREFGDNRDFPNDGKDDALGGYYGSTITKLVAIRNSHGRGNFRERWVDDAFNSNGFSNVYVYERDKTALVGLNSRNDAVIESRTVNSAFAPGTVLVELTGNAADSTVDPNGLIPETVRVKPDGKVDVAMPGNQGHGRGYVIYGVAPPQGTLTLSNTTTTLAGATPSAANNGTARLTNIDVVTADSFTVQLTTNPMTLPAPAGESLPVRDVHADGDYAALKLDGGLDLNGNDVVDNVIPGSVKYGFEDFGGTNVPGYIWNGTQNVGTGSGVYTQSIDATQLSEGRHYLTVRAFRHRSSSTGGDGGPEVFKEITKTIYVDRLKPEAGAMSFAPFASDPNNQANRDLVVQSTDGTANKMHLFLDLPADTTEAEILAMVQAGQGITSSYDRDSFIRGFRGVRGGNHAATVAVFEETGNFNVQRLSGLASPFGATAGLGAGFGDLDGNGLFAASDLVGIGNNSFEDVLYSQQAKFNAAADVDADGLVTNLDLFDLGDALLAAGASAPVLAAYDDLLLRRGDVDGNGMTDLGDVTAIYASLGQANWTRDLDADGLVTTADVDTLLTRILHASHADFDLNGQVDGADFLVWQRGYNTGTQFGQGDANLDGVVSRPDLDHWLADFGNSSFQLSAAESTVAVPEPVVAPLELFVFSSAKLLARRRSRVWARPLI
jgi:glycosidase